MGLFPFGNFSITRPPPDRASYGGGRYLCSRTGDIKVNHGLNIASLERDGTRTALLKLNIPSTIPVVRSDSLRSFSYGGDGTSRTIRRRHHIHSHMIVDLARDVRRDAVSAVT